MHGLFLQKLLTIIPADALEKSLARSVCNRGAGVCTIVKARGAGFSGERAREPGVDTGITFHLNLPQS